jgi:hypothetical protein
MDAGVDLGHCLGVGNVAPDLDVLGAGAESKGQYPGE